jgi:hypothetical protein
MDAVLTFIITALASAMICAAIVEGYDKELAKYEGFTCTASERVNATEPPEFECVKYEKEAKR